MSGIQRERNRNARLRGRVSGRLEPSRVVAALQDQADGPFLQTVAAFKVQATPIGNTVAGKHEQMPASPSR